MSRHLLASALAACALAACHGKSEAPPPAAPQDTGPAASSEKEPNNDSKSAQVLAAPAKVNGSFAAGGKADEDWYRLDAPAATIARLEVSGAAADVEVFDADHNKLLKASSSEGASTIVPNVTCMNACFFRVFPAKKDATGDYTLTLATSAPGPRSEKEPNNRYVDAQPLALGGAVDGFIGTPDDEDWYLFTPTGLAPDQVVQLSLASPPDVRLELAIVRQSDQAPLATYKAGDVGQDLKLRDLAAPSAPESAYFLVVRSAYVSQGGKKSTRLANPKVSYTLEAKAMPGAPNLELEPNEDAAHATPMNAAAPAPAPAVAAVADGGTTVDPAAAPAPAPAAPASFSLVKTGYLSPKGDSDWFMFHVDQPSIVHADVTGLDKVNLTLAIIDPAKKNDEKDNELAKADQGDVKEPETLAGVAVPAGDNYIRVEGAWKKVDDRYVKDYENATDPYTLTVDVAPDDGTWEREPNNVPDKATPVTVGHDYKGFLQPAKDVDLWRLDLTQATNVAITVGPVPKLDVVLTVKDLNKDGAIVGTMDKNKIEAEERLVVPFEPGSYLIEVREKGKESNPQRPYTLSLK